MWGVRARQAHVMDKPLTACYNGIMADGNDNHYFLDDKGVVRPCIRARANECAERDLDYQIQHADDMSAHLLQRREWRELDEVQDIYDELMEAIDGARLS